MGAWDETVFGNDYAADFSGEVSDLTTFADVVDHLRTALDDVLGTTGYLDNLYASFGLAAAALIAAWERPSLLPKTPYEPERWPSFNEPLPAELRAKAAEVIDRVLSPDENEFYDLWIDADLWDNVTADVQRYRSALL